MSATESGAGERDMVTCPTECVETNHPGMEHEQWSPPEQEAAVMRLIEVVRPRWDEAHVVTWVPGSYGAQGVYACSCGQILGVNDGKRCPMGQPAAEGAPYLHPDDGHTLDCTALVSGAWRCLPECPKREPLPATPDADATSESIIASLRARLDAVSALADHLVGNEAAPLIREALNGYTPASEPKCEGRTPFDCGNPLCPAHPAPAASTDASGALSEAVDRVQRFLDERERPMPFAPKGFLPVDFLGEVTRTGDRLMASDLRALLAAARKTGMTDE